MEDIKGWACASSAEHPACLPAGALVAYVNILADVLSSVAGSIIPPGAEPSRNALMAGITFCGALPIAIFVRSPQVCESACKPQLHSLLGRTSAVFLSELKLRTSRGLPGGAPHSLETASGG